MAKRNYLVEGLSGTGKSSVYEELIRRGYMAVSTDRAWSFHVDPNTGLPGGPLRHDTHRWDERKAVGELERTKPDVLFVCGSSRNRDRFLPYFTQVFNLRIDDDTMSRRLGARTDDDWPLGRDGVELMLALNRSDEKPAGARDVDATRPLQDVVDELLRLANCTSRGDLWQPRWSKSGASTARSFVLPESALPTVQAGGIEYSWSGDLLETLLRYLVEHGIDLMQPDHDAAAPTVASVLTSGHRERYLARLDPTAFDGASLRRYYEEHSNELTAEGVEYAMLDGIAFLRDLLARLQPATVAVLVIG